MIPYAMLIMYGLFMIALIWKPGNLFMSMTDYPAQHFAFADYFRKLFLETRDLFPDFAGAIGGGQNIYNFSYYGLFRPDVILSFLIPSVPIIWILSVYAIFLYLFGGCLIYHWIRSHSFPKGICLLMGFMFLSSSVLFQSHRQLMFVNYMPFLIISLLGVDTYLKDKKTRMLVLGIFLMIMHSYYFSVSGILICSVYYSYRYYQTYKNSGNAVKFYIYGNNAFYKIYIWIFTAVMLSAMYLLPTALSMLENIRGSNEAAGNFQFLDFNYFCNTIIYDYYGCGFSFFIWFTLCIGLTMKKTRFMSGCCILSLLLPIVPYLLNGTLYAHRKIYLTFIPVILYLCAKILYLKQKGTKSDEKHYILVALIPFVPLLCKDSNLWLLADAVITIFILYLSKKKEVILYSLVIVSSIVCLVLNYDEKFLTHTDYNRFYGNNSLSLSDDNENYRFSSLQGGVYKSNYVLDPNLWQTCIYSSIQSKNYQNFMNHTMHLSTTSRNNMVHTNASNIFFQIFMGTRILHSENILPAGYNATTKENIFVNDEVLPVAYGTSYLTGYEDFYSLNYPYTLDTLVNTSIVKKADAPIQYKSRIKEKILKDFLTFPSDSSDISFNLSKKNISVHSKTTTTFSLPIKNDADIVIVSAKLNSNESKNDISVKINGIKEKLSGTTAPYNNNNTTFEYVISSNYPVKELYFECSPGTYSLDDIQIFTCQYKEISKYHSQITPLILTPCSGKEILCGTLTMKQKGYFITSIPYQNGLSATIDGVPTKIENVNCGFAGFPVNDGVHNIVLSFHSPGKKEGIIISILGIFICILGFIIPKYRKTNIL